MPCTSVPWMKLEGGGRVWSIVVLCVGIIHFIHVKRPSEKMGEMAAAHCCGQTLFILLMT